MDRRSDIWIFQDQTLKFRPRRLKNCKTAQKIEEKSRASLLQLPLYNLFCAQILRANTNPQASQVTFDCLSRAFVVLPIGVQSHPFKLDHVATNEDHCGPFMGCHVYIQCTKAVIHSLTK